MKTQPPRILIPSDWDGESWECFQIQWPNSPEWLAVLRGLVTLPMRGRNWDENSGTIKDVQQVGYQIEAANIPLTTCDGDGVPGDGEVAPVEVIRFIYTGDGEEVSDLSWVCGVNPAAFKIEDGVLSVRNFCGEWVEIGSLTSPTDVAPPDVWEDVDPAPDFYGCGKVNSLIDYMVALSSALWENYDNPQTIEAAARAAVPPATLSRARIYQWIASLVQLDTVGLNQDNFENTTAIQSAKCYAAALAEDTSTGTVDEKEACEEGMATSFYNLIGLLAKAQWKAYWHTIQETIGDQDCLMLLSLGAADDTADCECPASVQASKIYFSGDYTHVADDYVELNEVVAMDGGRRVRIQVDAYQGSWRAIDNLYLELLGADAGDDVTFRYYPDLAWGSWTGFVPEFVWRLTSTVSVPEEYGYGELGTGTYDFDYGTQWMEQAFTLTAGQGPVTNLQYGGRFNPQDGSAGAWSLRFFIEIVSVNGIDLTPIGP